VVRLTHLLETSVGAWEQLALSAAFYAQPWDPDAPVSGFVDTVPTPDGVVCDLYYQSGGMPPDPPPPPPPPEVDAGHLTAGTAGELLAIDFDGAHYGVDSRATGDPAHPLPGWLVPGPIDLGFAGGGAADVPAFTAPAVLPSAPTILAPPPGPTPAPLEPDGTHLVAWQPGDATEVGVRLDFNLDWDNAVFICHPPSGVTELRLPHDWLTQFTWGSGELTVEARNPTVAPPASAYVALRPVRARRQSVYFEVW
ncbi:MAG: hypothetical protein IT373_19880, partial [Polyangiaceae bacterium]|nr:hypothetical protein [Polyangiaceae bacterium]